MKLTNLRAALLLNNFKQHQVLTKLGDKLKLNKLKNLRAAVLLNNFKQYSVLKFFFLD